MNRKELTENLAVLAGLQYDLYRKFPKYVSMDITLSTDHKGKERIKYNIYTPEVNHNNYSDFNDFVRFVKSLIKDGVVKVRVNCLKTTLSENQKIKEDAIDRIAEARAELEKLETL